MFIINIKLNNDAFKIRNPKVGLYSEDDKNYMTLGFNLDTYSGNIFKCEIPMIDLNNISVFNERNENIKANFNPSLSFYPHTYNQEMYLKLKILPIKNEYLTLTDITPYKEMSIKDIESELGYKIKLKKDEE